MFSSVRNILIIKPSALGDIIHSLPVLHALKQGFPEARVDWVVAQGLHRILEGHPLIHRLWVIHKDQWKKPGRILRTVQEIMDLRRGLAGQGYDVAIDLSGLLRSGIITGFSRARIKLGFRESDEGSPFFYTHKISGSMDIHAIDRYLEMARFMGCPVNDIVYPFAPYPPDPEILKTLPESYIIMCPSAGKPANRWPAERFGQLAARLKLPVVVIAAAQEADIAHQVVAHSHGTARSIAGQTSLADLPAVIGRASGFVCNDTGPMHIAAAMNIPVFALFGPANPVRTGPYGSIHTIIRKDYPCMPCYARHPCTRFGFRCMMDLSVDTVHQVILEKTGGL